MKHDRQWLDELLADLRVHRGDTTSVEVKRASGGMPEDIGTTICTFANLPGGGDIILGVHEAGGFSFPGVSDAAETEAALASIARQTVPPSPYLETRTIDYDGVQIVIAHVTALSRYLVSTPMDGVWSLGRVWLCCPAINGPGGVAARSRDTR